MSDETRVNEAEAATEAAVDVATEAPAEAASEEQPADETQTEEESVPQAVAEVVSESSEEEPDNAGAEVAAAGDGEESNALPPEKSGAEKITYNRVEGPANFNRAKQGNQRRNPRHVGNDVRIDEIDYKNVQVLSRFVDNYGRIHNRRKTRVTAKLQRRVTRAIKRARHLALMPYTGEHIRITGRRN